MGLQGIFILGGAAVKRILNVLLLAAMPALLFSVEQATAAQSTTQSTPDADATQPQATNQASSHDRHHRRHSNVRRHRHRHNSSAKH